MLVESFTGNEAANTEAEKALRRAIELWSDNVFAGAQGAGIARACLGRAIFELRGNDPQSCKELCAGYAAIATTFPDKSFVKRVAGWIEQQGCNCGASGAKAS